MMTWLLIRKMVAWAHVLLLNITEPTWQDIIEANRQAGFGVDEIDVKIIESIEWKKAQRWIDFHAKYKR